MPKDFSGVPKAGLGAKGYKATLSITQIFDFFRREKTQGTLRGDMFLPGSVIPFKSILNYVPIPAV